MVSQSRSFRIAAVKEELYIVPADGSESPRALTRGNQNRFYNPQFSPDGDRIAISGQGWPEFW